MLSNIQLISCGLVENFRTDVLCFILTVCPDRRDLFVSHSSVLEEIFCITRQNSRNKVTQRHVYHTTRSWTLTLDEILKPPLTKLIQVAIIINNSFHFCMSIFHTTKNSCKHLWIFFSSISTVMSPIHTWNISISCKCRSWESQFFRYLSLCLYRTLRS